MSSAREHRLDALTDAGDSWRADAARKSPIANHGSRLRVGSFDIYVAHTTHPATLVGAFEKSSADKEVPSMLVSTAKGVASSPAATPGGQRSHPSRGCARGLYATPLRYLCELPLKLILVDGVCLRFVRRFILCFTCDLSPLNLSRHVSRPGTTSVQSPYELCEVQDVRGINSEATIPGSSSAGCAVGASLVISRLTAGVSSNRHYGAARLSRLSSISS